MKHALHSPRRLVRRDFQALLQGASVDLFELQNSKGAFVKVCNYGARVVQFVVPDSQGHFGDVALGFNDLASLLRPSPTGVPSMGAFIGRYANRIANAAFTLDERSYRLSQNSGSHCIHGGQGGSRYAVFSATQTAVNQLELRHTFTPANDGFPGTLNLCVTYTLDDADALRIAWQATAVDEPTVANFTSHIFFNLSKNDHHALAAVGDHSLQLHASRYLPLQANQAPTGELLAVEGTPFDLRQPTPLAAQLHSPHPQIALCGGYDHHFAIDDWDGALKPVATLHEAHSGRTLTVSSTEPGVQLFTANGLEAAQCGFAKHSGLCIEPSYFPDSPNQPHFPSTRLAAGASRCGEIVYAMSA